MKFACDKCNTRYSIADERVKGRVLKIRCKTCNHVITVREESAAHEVKPVAARPSATGGLFGGSDDEAEHTVVSGGPGVPSSPLSVAAVDEWYVSFDGEQEGPLPLLRALDRVRAERPRGKEVHCWRPGFFVWLPIDEVPEFARALEPARPAAAAQPARAGTTGVRPATGGVAAAAAAAAPGVAKPRKDPSEPVKKEPSSPGVAKPSVAKDPTGPRAALGVAAPAKDSAAPAKEMKELQPLDSRPMPLPPPPDAPAAAPVAAQPTRPEPAAAARRPSPTGAMPAVRGAAEAPRTPLAAARPAEPARRPTGAFATPAASPAASNGAAAPAARAMPAAQPAAAARPAATASPAPNQTPLSSLAPKPAAVAKPAPTSSPAPAARKAPVFDEGGATSDPDMSPFAAALQASSGARGAEPRRIDTPPAPLPPPPGDDLVIGEASGLLNLAHLKPGISGVRTAPRGSVETFGGVPINSAAPNGAAVAAAPQPVVVMSGAAPRGPASWIKYVAIGGGAMTLLLGMAVVYLLTKPPKVVEVAGQENRKIDDRPLWMADPGSPAGQAAAAEAKKGGSRRTGSPGANRGPVAKGGASAPTPSGDKEVSNAQRNLAALYGETDSARPREIAAPNQPQRRGGGGGGSVSESALAAVVQQNRPAMGFCYQRVLKHDPTLKSAKIVARVKIGISGRVTSLAFGDPQMAQAEIGQCLAQSIKRWNFPASDSEYDFEFPVVFQAN